MTHIYIGWNALPAKTLSTFSLSFRQPYSHTAVHELRMMCYLTPCSPGGVHVSVSQATKSETSSPLSISCHLPADHQEASEPFVAVPQQAKQAHHLYTSITSRIPCYIGHTRATSHVRYPVSAKRSTFMQSWQISSYCHPFISSLNSEHSYFVSSCYKVTVAPVT